MRFTSSGGARPEIELQRAGHGRGWIAYIGIDLQAGKQVEIYNSRGIALDELVVAGAMPSISTLPVCIESRKPALSAVTTVPKTVFCNSARAIEPSCLRGVAMERCKAGTACRLTFASARLPAVRMIGAAAASSAVESK